MRVSSYPYGPLGSNLYILSGFPFSDRTIIIDPCVSPERVEKESFDIDLDFKKVEAVFITHGHFDHIAYASSWKKALDEKGNGKAKFFMSPDDKLMLQDPSLNCSADFMSTMTFDIDTVDISEADGKEFFGGSAKCRILKTPGHSAGQVCIMFYDLGEDVLNRRDFMFTGDMLFAGSIGRTDLKSGNPIDMSLSIEIMNSLEGDFTILPGHGPATSLANEKRTNPYLNSDLPL